VDIISISWVVTKRNPALKAVIQKAVDDYKILVYCSTADIGSQSHGDVYPANYDRLVTAVSASNRFGWARVESCHDVHVMLGGEEVTAQGPKYMQQSNRRVSGSSVATALAAGLASLCLFLARMANDRDVWDEFKDRDAMLHIFRKMQESDNNRVITPAKLFGDGFEVKDDFYRGTYEPPSGLQKLKWAILSKEINRNAPFSGEYPRRAMSAERSKHTRPTQARQPTAPIAVSS
jgi:Subtilase family